MIADLAEAILTDGGYEVCGIARTVADAVALARQHKPDLAVLDVRLADGGLGTEIAVQLLPLGRLGVLYATGNMSQVTLTATEGDACLSKPYSPNGLLRSLKIVAEIVENGKASSSFPKGFQVLPNIDTMTMMISDDGAGFKVQTESKRHGLGLVRRLVEQVRGKASLDSENGTVWTIEVPVPPSSSLSAIVPIIVGVNQKAA